MEIQYKEEEIGREYLDALEKVIDIRKDRRKLYNDSFLDNSIVDLLTIIDGKRNRFDFIKENNDLFVDKMEDEIIDIINYYLFVLCLLNKMEIKK